MAFLLENFDQIASATGHENLRNLWAYTSATDTIAEIEASGYFNDVWRSLATGDTIFLKGSDGIEEVNVTVTGMVVTVAPDTSSIPDNSITNLKINTNAGIEFSKLESLDSAEIIVGNSSNVPTARAMSGDITINNTGVTAIESNKVVFDQLNATVMKQTTVTVSAAAFNGMYNTPIQLVAPQGANYFIFPLWGSIQLLYNSAAFAAGGDIVLQYGNTAAGGGLVFKEIQTTIAAATADRVQLLEIELENAVDPVDPAVINNVGLYMSNITQAFTTGNSSFSITLAYRIVLLAS